MALGKPDHPGQVMAETRGVSISRYFGRTSSHSRRSEPTKELVAKVLEEVSASLREEVRDSIREEVK